MGLLAKHQFGEGVLILLEQHVQEGQLYLLTKAIEEIQEGDQLCSYMGPDDESIVHVSKP